MAWLLSRNEDIKRRISRKMSFRAEGRKISQYGRDRNPYSVKIAQFEDDLFLIYVLYIVLWDDLQGFKHYILWRITNEKSHGSFRAIHEMEFPKLPTFGIEITKNYLEQSNKMVES